MRIFHLIHSLEGGGAESQMRNLALGLAGRGHEVHVGFLEPGANPAAFVDHGVRLHQLPRVGNNNPWLAWHLLKLTRRSRPDILHTWIPQMDIFGGFAAMFSGTPWLLREPSSAQAYPKHWKFTLRAWFSRRAAMIVANSEGGQDYWRRQIPSSNRRLIHNGLPLDAIDAVKPATLEIDVSADRETILYAGRLTSGRVGEKNLPTLLRAFNMIDKPSDAVLHLCGDGAQKAELEAMAADLGLSGRVNFTGWLPKTQLWALMKRVDAYVSLSAFEGCPNTVMEAMACGCPLVVSDIAAHREFLDSENALLVDPNDPLVVADALRAVLSTPGLARARATKAKACVQAYAIPTMVEKYEDAYASILGGTVEATACAA